MKKSISPHQRGVRPLPSNNAHHRWHWPHISAIKRRREGSAIAARLLLPLHHLPLLRTRRRIFLHVLVATLRLLGGDDCGRSCDERRPARGSGGGGGAKKRRGQVGKLLFHRTSTAVILRRQTISRSLFTPHTRPHSHRKSTNLTTRTGEEDQLFPPLAALPFLRLLLLGRQITATAHPLQQQPSPLLASALPSRWTRRSVSCGK